MSARERESAEQSESLCRSSEAAGRARAGTDGIASIEIGFAGEKSGGPGAGERQ
ncbi:hypothetical protein GCWU000341_01292 [Oribacterium sp. oral taxon 078 str. F0262]|nr:hypothetical protein GCWU000341_01292 [Oribacterium sp. oral taxon 078 str. F0262]